MHNLSSYVRVDEDNKADHVVGVEHPMMQAGGNYHRQQSEPTSSAANMEEPTPVNTAGVNSTRRQIKLKVQLTKEELTMICQPTSEAEEDPK